MGLDSVEIVMGWEEALGVTITDAEATVTRTPRMATDLLAAKLGAVNDQPGACLTLRAFNRLRHAFLIGAGLPRDRITPKARLRDLLPHDRKSRWRAIQSASSLPALPGVGWGVGLVFEATTVADVVHWVICHSAKALKAQNEPWTRSEVRAVVRTVVTDVCGATKFSDDDDFIYDIGID
jgi:hypothetical protein